jgi:starch synthase
MKDKRILYVSSEVVPYLPETEIASTAFNVAKKAHSKGVQTRIFMPRFGVINESNSFVWDEFNNQRYGYAFDY